MSLESATYVSQLIPANPAFDDLKSQGDDHLRLIKSTLTTCFPNVGGAVLVTVTPAGSHTWAGTHSFTGASVSFASPSFDSPTFTTQPVGTSNTTAATTSFVQAVSAADRTYANGLAFSTSLPAQAGNAGLTVTTDGATASWGVTIPDSMAILNFIGYK